MPFRTKLNQAVPSVTPQHLAALRQSTISDLGLSQEQLVEGASFSLAMVIRYALGLTAAGGTVGALIRDTFSGWVAAAAVRHLVNSGAVSHVVIALEQPGQTLSPELQRAVKTLEALGVIVYDWSPGGNDTEFGELLKQFHNILVGVYSASEPGHAQFLGPLFDILNDLPTPAHAIELPYGIDPLTGKADKSALFASSTLSLGLPLQGLDAGFDNAGRHYLCDAGLSRDHYASVGYTENALFADQPVIQLNHE